MNVIFENLFSWILFVLTIVTGIAYFYDYKFTRPKRLASVDKARKETAGNLNSKLEKEMLEPKDIIGQTGSLFFVILFVFVFRSFIIEPFRIPSGSMLPTLQDGDFIAVSKWSYGIRNPLTNSILINTSTPQRGDVIVFKYPEDKNVDFIKRVVGLPGDIVIYQNKNIYILKVGSDKDAIPEQVSTKLIETLEEEISGIGLADKYEVYEEQLGDISHRMRVNTNAPMMSQYFYKQENTPVGMWRVPDNCYFVMGDNRDNSKDSRFWGFVPMENIKGKTLGIWLSFDFKHDSSSSMPEWLPSAVRFDRIGGLK